MALKARVFFYQVVCGFPAKHALKFFVTLLFSWLLISCSANSIHRSGQTSRVHQLSARDAASAETSVPIRHQAMRDTAMRYGAQQGLATRTIAINKVLEYRERYLDRIFNFNALLLPHNLLPPVLVEARDTLKLDAPDAIRLADRTYKIIQPAHFVTSAPSWRDYLWLNYQKPEEPDPSVMPRSRAEREIWDMYIQQGWMNGIEQANQMLLENLGRLTRDYIGMVLYSNLLAKHMISPPYVAKAKLGITGDPTEMHLNDQVVRITGPSMLQPNNSKDWQPALSR